MIKIGYLVSYDYDLLLTSLARVYEHVDRIFLAIDKDRKTWSGTSFDLPESFFKKIVAFDTKNKIEFYFDNFFVNGLSPMESDVRERIMLSKKMGKGWLIQLDVDEYIYDFDIVSKFLRRNIYLTYFPKLVPIAFRGTLVTLFKKTQGGYLYIDNGEKFSFISNYPHYEHARSNGAIINYLIGTITIHQSWAREDEEIKIKINNWGHRDDFNTSEYFQFWKSLNKENYKKFKDIHPLFPPVWDEIKFLESTDINDFIDSYSKLNPQKLIPFSSLDLLKKVVKRIIRKIKS